MGVLKSLARVGDPSTVFYGCSPDFAMTGSPTFINEGKAAHRKGDLWTYHLCPAPPATPNTVFSAYLFSGSSYFIVNSLEIGRVGDPVFRDAKISGPMPYIRAFAYIQQGSGSFLIGAAGDGVTTPRYARSGQSRSGDLLFNPAG